MLTRHYMLTISRYDYLNLVLDKNFGPICYLLTNFGAQLAGRPRQYGGSSWWRKCVVSSENDLWPLWELCYWTLHAVPEMGFERNCVFQAFKPKLGELFWSLTRFSGSVQTFLQSEAQLAVHSGTPTSDVPNGQCRAARCSQQPPVNLTHLSRKWMHIKASLGSARRWQWNDNDVFDSLFWRVGETLCYRHVHYWSSDVSFHGFVRYVRTKPGSLYMSLSPERFYLETQYVFRENTHCSRLTLKPLFSPYSSSWGEAVRVAGGEVRYK